MSLFPSVVPDDDLVTLVDTLDPSKVSVSLTDDKGTALTLSDYMAESDIAALKSKGQVKFIEGKTGSFKLTLSYAGGAISTMKDITYAIQVIDGYNINQAKDLFVLNNDDVDGDKSGGEGPKANDAVIRKWKEAKGIPFDRNYHVGIFQKDVVLGKDDIPDDYIWDSTRDSSLAALDGSLKDSSYLVKHTFQSTDSADELNFAVYGNYHKLSLGSDFPFIIREGLDPATAITGNMAEKETETLGTPGEASLVISHVSKRYGNADHLAVTDFSISLHGGHIYGFLGKNGAGKSTIIKSVVGLHGFEEGTISICGYDVVTQPTEAKMCIGYVPDNYALYENLTGRQYVSYIADLYRVSRKDREARVPDLLKRLEMEAHFDMPMKTYSHGMVVLLEGWLNCNSSKAVGACKSKDSA